ncbi:MAG: phenylalanine--tRNA ligase subunit beta [Deltaproteobacteria bacterium]|nr:phenylalanine--tRNA ligase subunit beta [Deltaproteobacteria bacterium]
MRISFKWLKELLDIPAELSARDVADRLTLAGLEVESVEDLAAAYRNIVVGTILTRDKHPNSEKLSLCTVDVGEPAPLSIVCGAPNCEPGSLVPVARVGALLPGGLAIAERAVAGVMSQGMMCSSKELALPSGNHDGLMLLEPGLTNGTPFARVVQAEDHVLHIGVTPNRPDALSHVGVARDLAAALSMPSTTPPPNSGPNPTPHGLTVTVEEAEKDRARRPAGAAASTPAFRVKPPSSTCAERGGPIDDGAQVRIEDPLRCARYCARVIEGVTVGPSPAWLVRRLEACGMRSINNIVDVTNLLLMERGHPLHAFDMDKLALERGRPTVVVRCAKPGEKLTTLDGVERVLNADDLCICDPDKPIALAGVMGGRDTEVHAGTTRVLLEAAYFDPSGVRRTARRHGLHTEASHRFERGCDPNRTLDEALNRAAQLFVDLGGGQVRRGIAQAYPRAVEPLEVTLRPARAAQLLGMPGKLIDEALVARALTALGLEVAGREAGAIRFRVPTFRPDLVHEVDLVEEVGRLLGLDRIPEMLPRGSGRLMQMAESPRMSAVDTVREALVAAGFDEAVNMGFLSPRELAPFDGEGTRIPRLTLRNALSEEVSVMRSTLLPALLRNLAHNHRHGEHEVRLFELGTVFHGARPEGADPRPHTADGPPGGDAYALERCHAGFVMTGTRGPAGHQARVSSPLDFYDAKGVVEELLGALGLRADLWDGDVRVVPAGDGVAPHLHPGKSATVMHQGVSVGTFGVLHPAVGQGLDLPGDVLVGELDLGALASRMPGAATYRAIPRFPAVRRDLSALVEESLSVEQLFGAVRGTRASSEGLLERVELFDLYRDDKLPKGKKSVGISLTFRSPDKTLTDDVVNGLHQEVMSSVEKELRAEVRKA